MAASCASLARPTTDVSTRDKSGDVTAMQSVGRANFSSGMISERVLYSSVGLAPLAAAASAGTGVSTITAESGVVDGVLAALP